MNENLLSSLVSLSVEFRFAAKDDRRNLTSLTLFFFQIASLVWVFGKICTLSIIVSKTTSPISYLHDGLHIKKAINVYAYYIHFIAYRVILALLVFLGGVVSGKFVIGLIFLQVLSILFNLRFAFFESKMLLFQIFIVRELTLLIIAILITIVEFTKS